MRVGEDLRQLGHLRENDRLAQGLPHRMIGQSETGAEGEDHQAYEERPAGGENQETSAQRQRRHVEQQRRRGRGARARDVPGHEPSRRGKRAAAENVQQPEQAHGAQPGRM